MWHLIEGIKDSYDADKVKGGKDEVLGRGWGQTNIGKNGEVGKE